MNAQLSSKHDNWMTPVDIVERCRRVLGDIDLDPASSHIANARIKARRFFTQAGLEEEWGGNVFCNPPGGKEGKYSKMVLFWQKLMSELQLGRIRHAIFLCFSLEALQSTQNKNVPPIGQFLFCIPSKRIKFDFFDGSAVKHQPTHGNVIVYVPGSFDNSEAFFRNFNDLGIICNDKNA